MTVSPVEPVSTMAVAMMVSEPPCSMLRAAPRNRFGGYSAVESTPPDRMRPDAGDGVVVGAAQPGDRVEQHDNVLALLHQPLGPLDREFGGLGVVLTAAGRRSRR